MNRSYWEMIAPSYDDEIFDLLENDSSGLVRAAIAKYASPKASVIDIGCAIGKWLPVLSPAFKKVIAVDISAKNLVQAKQRNARFDNIEYQRADMSGKPVLAACHVGICINAILTDSLKNRTAFFSNLKKCIRPRGILILTVPSLESWLLTNIVQQQWKIDSKIYHSRLSAQQGAAKYKNMLQGNADIDKVPTKHYLKEELQLLLATAGFAVLETSQIKYEWTTEFIKPPKWLKEPKPWDWLVVAKRKS